MKFLYACKYNKILHIRNLTDEKMSFKDQNGNNGIIIACQYKNTEILKKLLLYNNSYTEHQNNNGYTALMWACINNNIEIVNLLLATGNAHPEYQNTEGYGALMIACYNNNITIVKLLLATGNAHPEYQDNNGYTALMRGCRNNNIEIVKLLLATGNAHPEYRIGKRTIEYGNNQNIKKCIRIYRKTRRIIRKIKLIIKVVVAFKKYDKGKPYSCEMFYLMGLDGVLPDENINVIDYKTNVKNKINKQQLNFMKLGYEEATKV